MNWGKIKSGGNTIAFGLWDTLPDPNVKLATVTPAPGKLADTETALHSLMGPDMLDLQEEG